MISGKTRLVAIVGSPIAQVKSPENFNDYFSRASVDRIMLPIDLEAKGLDEFISCFRAWRNLDGCVVTVPYKAELATRIDELSPRAQFLGAVNVIRRSESGDLNGDNVDGLGFLTAVGNNEFAVEGTSALVVGCGGVGSAIAYALCEAGTRKLDLIDTDSERVQSLADRLSSRFPSIDIGISSENLGEYKLVVNASPLGMRHGDPLPIPEHLLQTLVEKTLVADVVTSPKITPLLAFAKAHGCKVQTGAEMALAQMEALARHMGVQAENAPNV